jgi:small-conductance mechanosensitive channel
MKLILASHPRSHEGGDSRRIGIVFLDERSKRCHTVKLDGLEGYRSGNGQIGLFQESSLEVSVPEEISSWIEQTFRISVTNQNNLLYSLVLIIGLLILRQVVNYLLHRRTDNAEAIYRWRKAMEYVTLFLGIIGMLLIWLPDTRSFATYLGLVSAGLAIALQDPLTDFVGWIFIIWRHPFAVGDRIQIGGQAGDVVDIRYFQFSILEIGNWVDADQSTGRVIHIPNKKVFTESLANYTEGLAYIWNELAVMITFESDWAKAKKILQDIVAKQIAHKDQEAKKQMKQLADRFYINYENLTPIVYTRVVDSGIRLTIRYLTLPRKRRSTENQIWEDILTAFAAEPGIDFAYPTVRRYLHNEEGKPALRPEALYGEGDGEGR